MKSQKDKQKALALHLEGKSETKIAKEVGVSRPTIQLWKKQDNWRELKQRAKRKTLQKVVDKYADLEEKHTELTYKAIIEALRRLEGMTDKEIVALSKLQTPISQTKITQEINKGIIYQFEVKDADRDTKDTIIKEATRSIPDTE